MICREKSGTRSHKWRRQTIIQASKDSQITTNVIAVTLKDSFVSETIGLAALTPGGSRVMKWPFFGTKRILEMGYDGTKFDKPLGPDDEAELRARLEKEGIWVPVSGNEGDQTTPTEPTLASSTQRTTKPLGETTDTTTRQQRGQTNILDYFSVPQQPQPPRPSPPPPPSPLPQVPQPETSLAEEPCPDADARSTLETHEAE